MPSANIDFGRTLTAGKRSRKVYFAAVAAATALLLVGGFVGVRTLLSGSGDPLLPAGPTNTPTPAPTPTPSPSATPAPTATCSASGLDAEPVDQPGLPDAVAQTRRRIVELAVACDFEGLAELGRQGDPLSFSFGADRDAAKYWRMLERDDLEEVMAFLVETLDLSHCMERYESADVTFYSWPAVSCSGADDADWAEVEPLYDAEQIEQMKQFGSGFLGYRVGITQGGDWIYYIAGD